MMYVKRTIAGPAHSAAATDFMGIITGPVSAAAQTSIRGIVAKIRDADPNLFPARIVTPPWASDQERDLFASFACPGTVTANPPATSADTVRVLQHLHIRHHDFGDAGSASLENAMQLCRRALRDGDPAEVERLWNALRARAAPGPPLLWRGADTLHESLSRDTLVAGRDTPGTPQPRVIVKPGVWHAR